MRLVGQSPSKIDLERLIDDEVQGDYVYMYPPRQAYRPMAHDELEKIIHGSLSRTRAEPVNLYLHFPFCQQICKFCNLYSVAARPDESYADYVRVLSCEISRWADITQGRRVDTIYFGGGTPSILPATELNRCLTEIERAFGISRSSVPEIALEVAPDTVDEVKLRDLSDIGITRVNLGLQTTSDQGLRQIGRNHGFSLARKHIEAALGSGFDNVCIDLIYGLPHQDLAAWQTIVQEVLAFGAPTVCAYPLTLRPNTGFARQHLELSGAEQYSKYDVAREMLTDSGYVQETHVRYVVPNVGGYRQKANHWAGQDVIGIGAGARGYLRSCDYRNGYSIKRRRTALEGYLASMNESGRSFTSGIELSTDERMRRQVILGLLHLDRARFQKDFGIDVLQEFASQFAELSRLGLVEIDEERVRLNDRGRRFRDVIVQVFFSQDVWQKIAEFDYTE